MVDADTTTPAVKTCPACGEIKTLAEFRPGRRACRDCIRAEHRRSYPKWKAAERLRAASPKKAAPTLRERFWAKVDKNGPVHPVLGTRCWVWTAALDPNGYGRFGLPRDGVVKHHTVTAHRYAYEQHVGPIPEGYGVLHRCDNPPCVNYEEHLFPGTQQDNVLDMWSKGRVDPQKAAASNRNRTHCRRGHEWTEANTYRYKERRLCRTCCELRASARVFLPGGVYLKGSGIRSTTTTP